jgi:hypothetical protein
VACGVSDKFCSAMLKIEGDTKMSIYAEARIIESIDCCYFYHAIDIPGVGTISRNWDLRQGLDKYLGGVEFMGKRVLDVGCANGILSFYAKVSIYGSILLHLRDPFRALQSGRSLTR